MRAIGKKTGQPTDAALDRMLDEGFMYRVAFMHEADGCFEVEEVFMALNDEYANEYAAAHYAGREWYVLDADHNNING